MSKKNDKKRQLANEAYNSTESDFPDMCVYSLYENPTETTQEKFDLALPCKAAEFTRMKEIYEILRRN